MISKPPPKPCRENDDPNVAVYEFEDDLWRNQMGAVEHIISLLPNAEKLLLELQLCGGVDVDVVMIHCVVRKL
ncbi:hypothetical protein AALP_AA3G147500 [Arabis alpina]|uniref:Uncharacterized protein n=1 Tax=Arabis alpina TaxID=50452 RepID=A0A087H986_ARAAL|nr:hypothetical protein AALP_AA3G147500 [Arabis alpina]